jgi:glycosyltransferase involved in cell wall biosynthesis
MSGFMTKGIEVALLCRKGYPLEVQALQNGFRVFAFKNIFGAIFFMLTKGAKFDVFHAQTSHILTYCVLTKPFHRAKIFFTRRVFFTPKGIMTKIKYRLCDKLIAISNPVKEVVEKFCDKTVTVIPDAAVEKTLNENAAEEIRSEFSISRHKSVIGTIAVMSQEKDPFTIIEGIKQLYAKRQDFIFLHCGGGPLEDKVKVLIKQYQLDDVYKIIGFQDNIEDFFAVFDIFVMASRQEGMGSSVLDAFLYKVPVVSTDAGGLADIIKDGRAVMFRPAAPGMLADGIELLLNQPLLGNDMAEKAYHYVKKVHSIDTITQQYLELLK